jgi:hypothetical protein
VCNTRLRGGTQFKGHIEDARLRALFHVTVTPHGVVNITVDRFEVDCH